MVYNVYVLYHVYLSRMNEKLIKKQTDIYYRTEDRQERKDISLKKNGK